MSNYSTICSCTPKCHRTFYESFLSHSHISHATFFAQPFSNHILRNPAHPIRLRDYAYLDGFNRTWGDQLFNITKDYQVASILIRSSADEVLSLLGIMNDTDFNANCIVSSVQAYIGALTEFDQWERSSYYMNHTDINPPVENFQSRVAHDMLRKHCQMDTFEEGFLYNVEKLKNVTHGIDNCHRNNSILSDTVQRLSETLNEANQSFGILLQEHATLQKEVTSNPVLMSTESQEEQSRNNYIM